MNLASSYFWIVCALTRYMFLHWTSYVHMDLLEITPFFSSPGQTKWFFVARYEYLWKHEKLCFHFVLDTFFLSIELNSLKNLVFYQKKIFLMNIVLNSVYKKTISEDNTA